MREQGHRQALTPRGLEADLESKVEGGKRAHTRSRHGCFVAARFGGGKNGGSRDTGTRAGRFFFLIATSCGGGFEERGRGGESVHTRRCCRCFIAARFGGRRKGQGPRGHRLSFFLHIS